MLRALLLLTAIIGAVDGTSAQELEGRLRNIYDTGIIRLAYRSDANPFSFLSQSGKPDGYTIDLCKFVSGALGRELNKNLTTEWVPVDSQNRFDSIAAGVADIECGSSSVSFGRMTKVDFSSFIFMENTGLMVRLNSGISSFGDLRGKKIAVIVGTTNKDPTDPMWENDEGMKTYRAFFEKYLPGADISNTSYLTGYQQGILLEQILKQCGDDLSRENILRQAKALKDVVIPTALPGIKVNTGPTNNMVWTQMRLQRWNGTSWELFGEVLDAASD